MDFSPIRFLHDRFIQPAADAGVEKALAQSAPPAYGVSTGGGLSLAESIGQPRDVSIPLLYGLYKLNSDVSGCVHKRAGGATGAGWRITTMPGTDMTPALEKKAQELERWLRNPNPSMLFESMLYEGVENWGIIGNFN